MPATPEAGLYQKVESDLSSEIPLAFNAASGSEDRKLNVLSVFAYDCMGAWCTNLAKNSLNPHIEDIANFYNRNSLENSSGANKTIVMERDNVSLDVINEPKDIFEKIKKYHGQPLDFLFINAHGSHTGLYANSPRKSSASLTDLIKNYSRDDFAHVMKPNGRVILIACNTLEGYQQNLTIGEFVSYLLQRPTLASETLVITEIVAPPQEAVSQSARTNKNSEPKVTLYGKWHRVLPENDAEMKEEVRNRKFIDRLNDLANSGIEKFENFIKR